MEDIIKPQEGIKNKLHRPLILMIVVNLYFWWKLIGYIDLYAWSIGNLTFLQLMSLSLNIPIYFAGLLYIFKLRVNPQLFWKVWVVIAIADEIRMNITGFSGIGDFLEFTAPVIPIYIISVMYAYYSQSIWAVSGNDASKKT